MTQLIDAPTMLDAWRAGVLNTERLAELGSQLVDLDGIRYLDIWPTVEMPDTLDFTAVGGTWIAVEASPHHGSVIYTAEHLARGPWLPSVRVDGDVIQCRFARSLEAAQLACEYHRRLLHAPISVGGQPQ